MNPPVALLCPALPSRATAEQLPVRRRTTAPLRWAVVCYPARPTPGLDLLRREMQSPCFAIRAPPRSAFALTWRDLPGLAIAWYRFAGPRFALAMLRLARTGAATQCLCIALIGFERPCRREVSTCLDVPSPRSCEA